MSDVATRVRRRSRRGRPGRSRFLGAPACERNKGPMGLCRCPGCTFRRAVAVEAVGPEFPSIGAVLVRGAIEGA